MSSFTGCLLGSVLAVLLTGCASTKLDPVFVQTLREGGRATIANYSSGHVCGPGLVVAGPATLDDKCLAAIEEVLRAGTDIAYVERASLGLSGTGPADPTGESYLALRDKGRITGVIKLQLMFQVAPGFKKVPRLAVVWEVLTTEGVCKVKINTAATAGKSGGVFLNTMHPGYAETFAELARRNASQFLKLLSKPQGQ